LVGSFVSADCGFCRRFPLGSFLPSFPWLREQVPVRERALVLPVASLTRGATKVLTGRWQRPRRSRGHGHGYVGVDETPPSHGVICDVKVGVFSFELRAGDLELIAPGGLFRAYVRGRAVVLNLCFLVVFFFVIVPSWRRGYGQDNQRTTPRVRDAVACRFSRFSCMARTLGLRNSSFCLDPLIYGFLFCHMVF
jgi:hypothetical protein